MLLVESRAAWALLTASAVALELTALWFQYGKQLDPCVMCVYERVAVFGLVAAGMVGMAGARIAAVRWFAFVLWGVSGTWGVDLARRHVGFQFDGSLSLSCSFSAEFPGWFKLDEWLPSLFMPTGYCSDIQWQWLTLSMAQWMVVVFAVYLVILSVVLVAEWRHWPAPRWLRMS